jgi:hypothetical protein
MKGLFEEIQMNISSAPVKSNMSVCIFVFQLVTTGDSINGLSLNLILRKSTKTFCKLYPSYREPTEFLLVWSFLYMRFVIR